LEPAKVKKQYVQGWFWPDILSALVPFAVSVHPARVELAISCCGPARPAWLRKRR
jgi:hypothetical protein